MSTFFGLDIGSAQVKVLQAEKENHGFKLTHFAAVDHGSGKIAQTIQQAVKQAGIKMAAEANLALPESDVYTRIIETPKLSETELASSIQYEAEQYVPVSLEEVELYHQVLSDGTIGAEEKTMRVLLIAVPKERIKQLTMLMDQAGLIPKSLETELFSLKRIFSDEQKSQLLILFGHKTTDLMIMQKGDPLFLHSMASGGMALTKALMNELGLAAEQAEQYKRTYGLRADLLEGKVAKVLAPLIDEVVNQVNKAFVYVQQQGIKKLPEQVVITGGGALLPGLSAYLVSKLNIEVEVGDPLERFVKDEEYKKLITSEANPQLSTVVGLALKSWL
jgi:type IV pilus assembly protein PilM